MSISATTAATTSAAQTAADNNNTGLASNFTTFLTLLTTQLKNQDPTNPTDSNQFTQQLVAFAGVQQQSQANATLSSILSALQTNQVSSAASFVGTNIQAPGNQGALVNGNAEFAYNLPSTAITAEVTITNSSGTAVFNGQGTVNKGDNFVRWDGLNSINGSQESDGVFNITVKALDSKGNTITAKPFVTGTVTSASIESGTVMLNIGSLQIPQSSVTSVTNLTGTKNASTSTTTQG